jgi:NTP pyrophosphatase (non-canonical NTP hydrolase)
MKVLSCPFCKQRFEDNKIDDNDTNKCVVCGAEETKPDWETNNEIYNYRGTGGYGVWRLEKSDEKPTNYVDPDNFTTYYEYQLLAKTTAAKYPTMEKGALVFALGLAGETMELAESVNKWMDRPDTNQPEKIEKEIGDVLWYVSQLALVYGISLPREINLTEQVVRIKDIRIDCICVELDTLFVRVQNAVEMVKKTFGHNHPVNRDSMQVVIGTVLQSLVAISDHFNWTMLSVARKNVAKLRERYPDGFSTKRSMNREG